VHHDHPARVRRGGGDLGDGELESETYAASVGAANLRA
jgi:hypothetical protein